MTLKMKAAGFRTVYLNEKLSLGLAPEGLEGIHHAAQPLGAGLRADLPWARWVRFRRGNGLTLLDRISLIETFLYWSASYSFRLLGILVPILYWLFNIQCRAGQRRRRRSPTTCRTSSRRSRSWAGWRAAA